jgi:hypothetical protein
LYKGTKQILYMLGMGVHNRWKQQVFNEHHNVQTYMLSVASNAN